MGTSQVPSVGVREGEERKRGRGGDLHRGTAGRTRRRSHGVKVGAPIAQFRRLLLPAPYSPGRLHFFPFQGICCIKRAALAAVELVLGYWRWMAVIRLLALTVGVCSEYNLRFVEVPGCIPARGYIAIQVLILDVWSAVKGENI